MKFHAFCFFPKSVHLGQGVVGTGDAGFLHTLFYKAEAAFKFCIGTAQRNRGIDMQVPRGVNQAEKQVAEFRFGLFVRAVCKRLRKFGKFFFCFFLRILCRFAAALLS